MKEWLEAFKNREIKAKEAFAIKLIDKKEAYNFVRKYHYLGDAKFFSIYSYGLFHGYDLVGVATYSLPQGTQTLLSWFNIKENNDRSVLELMRLCLLPELNGTNATSFLLGNSIRLLKKEGIRAVITLAASNRHVGSIYQVCNFEYYGLTKHMTEFWCYNTQSKIRGKVYDIQGVWVNKPRKHRYAYIIDKSLKCNYEKQEKPSLEMNVPFSCCNGTKIVHDNRFNVDYTCPICTGHLYMIKDCKEILPNCKETQNDIYIYHQKQEISKLNCKLDSDAF